MEKRVAVIGNGAMTFDCIKILNENVKSNLLLVISDPKFTSPGLDKRLSDFCSDFSIDYIRTSDLNADDIENSLLNLNLDYIFNIDSFTIIKPSIFNIPKYGVVNFHNSYLPHYRGANATSWGIINDEKEFGVTWHLIDKGIDTGDILFQKLFDVRKNETARTLIFKCIEEGIKLFRDNISDLLNDNLLPQKQTGPESTYYRKNLPNEGYINLEWNARKIDCFVRGLDFRPFENKFVKAKLKIEGNEFIINKIKIINKLSASPAYSPGTLLQISEKGIEITCEDSIILIEDISDLEGNNIQFNSLDLNQHIDSNTENKIVA